MSTELSINQELEKWIIPLTREEFAGLTQSILDDGCREPLVVWGNVLVDGHNRYKICTRFGIDFKIHHKDFGSINDAKNWMIRNQLGRRNVTTEQRDYLMGKLYREQKQTGFKGNQHTDSASPQNDDKQKTSESIAEQFKVSKATVERAEVFADAVDTVVENCGHELKNPILNREYHATKSDIIKISKLPVNQQKKVMSEVQSGKHAKDAIDRVFGCQQEEKPTIPLDTATDSNILLIPCGNPRCQNTVITTKKQYRQLTGVNPEKYGTVELMYCSSSCRDAHMFRIQTRVKVAQSQN